MYEVKLYDGPEDKQGTIIHSPRVNDLKIEGSIKQGINLIDSFDFTFYMNNPGYTMAKPFKTLTSVLNTMTNEYEFEGRILIPTEQMSEDEIVKKSFVCEGELGYLHDAPQQHLEFRGTPIELAKVIIDHFNKQVEPYKRFEIGRVEVIDPNDYMYVYLSAEKTTYDEIMDKFVDRLSAELQIRKEDGVRYLDILKRVGLDEPTEIMLSKNLMSISKEVDPQDIITRLTPLGTRIESEDEEATDASEARLTIADVNNGLTYIDRQDLIDEFGIQGKSKTWDDVTLPDNLIRTGRDYLNNQKLVLNQFKLTALDLFLIGIDPQSLKVGNGHPVINPIMSINEVLRIIGKTIDINNPEVSNFSIGDKFKTLSEYQQESNLQANRVAELQNLVNRQSKVITSLSTQITTVNTVVDTINQQFGEADIPGMKEAVNDLNIAIDGLNGIVDSLPKYELATEDDAGLMSAVDKVKLNSLKVYQLATGVIDGLLAKEDKQKLNRITANQVIDLDQFKADFLALKAIVDGMAVE